MLSTKNVVYSEQSSCTHVKYFPVYKTTQKQCVQCKVSDNRNLNLVLFLYPGGGRGGRGAKYKLGILVYLIVVASLPLKRRGSIGSGTKREKGEAGGGAGRLGRRGEKKKNDFEGREN
jgi:hypothetical protein